jgi:hypothetical protein
VGPVEKISSLQNPRIKQLVRLRDRRPRDEAGVFLVEGYREIRRALEKGVSLRELYFSPDWFLGANDLKSPVYAPATGGCHDGLHPSRVNENQGAESTLSFLLALAEMKLLDNVTAAFHKPLAESKG